MSAILFRSQRVKSLMQRICIEAVYMRQKIKPCLVNGLSPVRQVIIWTRHFVNWLQFVEDVECFYGCSKSKGYFSTSIRLATTMPQCIFDSTIPWLNSKNTMYYGCCYCDWTKKTTHWINPFWWWNRNIPGEADTMATDFLIFVSPTSWITK